MGSFDKEIWDQGGNTSFEIPERTIFVYLFDVNNIKWWAIYLFANSCKQPYYFDIYICQEKTASYSKKHNDVDLAWWLSYGFCTNCWDSIGCSGVWCLGGCQKVCFWSVCCYGAGCWCNKNVDLFDTEFSELLLKYLLLLEY